MKKLIINGVLCTFLLPSAAFAQDVGNNNTNPNNSGPVIEDDYVPRRGDSVEKRRKYEEMHEQKMKEKMDNISPEEREKMKHRHEKMKNMSPAERKEFMDKREDKMDKRQDKREERHERREEMREKIKNLPPEKRDQVKQERMRHREEMNKIVGNSAPQGGGMRNDGPGKDKPGRPGGEMKNGGGKPQMGGDRPAPSNAGGGRPMDRK